MTNLQILKMINNGKIEELKNRLLEEELLKAKGSNSDLKKRTLAIKKYYNNCMKKAKYNKCGDENQAINGMMRHIDKVALTDTYSAYLSKEFEKMTFQPCK